MIPNTRKKQQKRRRYQTRLAQAEVELAFTTPSTISAWYLRWSKQNIYEDDLVESVLEWIERFPCISENGLHLNKSAALWSVIERLVRAETNFTERERIFNSLLTPNKLRLFID
ncbi:plasmid SOS inhibition protein A [Serratia liquefaciens]|uniref:plasmid SOS inhibition protein A n=1 Tax=Serratia liquefaciens TaxID=614 RepID=UPI001F5C9F0B|nr:plasmid SOS inhibition protein A [Serratia liquefaciens]